MSEKTGGTMSHTVAPWVLESGIVRGPGRDIAKIHYEYMRYGDPARTKIEKENDANGALIAAAPDLLVACQRLLGHANRILGTGVNAAANLEFRELLIGAARMAEAAIAKAEGR